MSGLADKRASRACKACSTARRLTAAFTLTLSRLRVVDRVCLAGDLTWMTRVGVPRGLGGLGTFLVGVVGMGSGVSGAKDMDGTIRM